MAVRFKLGDEDAAKYPQGDEWFEFDFATIRDMRARELMRLEAAMDGTTFAQIEVEYRSGAALGLLGVMFIARRLAGVNEKWESFDPQVWHAEWDRVVADDAEDEPDPPTGATEASPSS